MKRVQFSSVKHVCNELVVQLPKGAAVERINLYGPHAKGFLILGSGEAVIIRASLDDKAYMDIRDIAVGVDPKYERYIPYEFSINWMAATNVDSASNYFPYKPPYSIIYGVTNIFSSDFYDAGVVSCSRFNSRHFARY